MGGKKGIRESFKVLAQSCSTLSCGAGVALGWAGSGKPGRQPAAQLAQPLKSGQKITERGSLNKTRRRACASFGKPSFSSLRTPRLEQAKEPNPPFFLTEIAVQSAACSTGPGGMWGSSPLPRCPSHPIPLLLGLGTPKTDKFGCRGDAWVL